MEIAELLKGLKKYKEILNENEMKLFRMRYRKA